MRIAKKDWLAIKRLAKIAGEKPSIWMRKQLWKAACAFAWEIGKEAKPSIDRFDPSEKLRARIRDRIARGQKLNAEAWRVPDFHDPIVLERIVKSIKEGD